MVTLDTTTYVLSTEASHLKRSVIRELLAHAVDPQMISLAGGLPASEFLPLEAYRECLNAVMKRDGAQSLQYRPQYTPLREWLADYMQQRGVKCTPQQIYITNGNQNGLAILSRLFLNPGDTAVIEAITFTGIKLVTAGRGMIINPFRTSHQSGADMDDMEAVFASEPRPRLAVLIPDFHNPLGVSLSLAQRQRAAHLAAKYHVPLIEDDPYSPLRFSGEPLPPIKAFDEAGYVFYLGSFSKMLAPALRLGWMDVPEALAAKIADMRESFDLESSALTQRAVHEFLARGYLPPHLEQLNAANQARAQALLAALEAHFSGVATWTQPEGGLFIWLELPPHINTWDLLPEALDNKVVYIPGGAFSVNDGANNTMRLNYSNVTPQKIAQGIERLAKAVKRQL